MTDCSIATTCSHLFSQLSFPSLARSLALNEHPVSHLAKPRQLAVSNCILSESRFRKNSQLPSKQFAGIWFRFLFRGATGANAVGFGVGPLDQIMQSDHLIHLILSDETTCVDTQFPTPKTARACRGKLPE